MRHTSPHVRHIDRRGSLRGRALGRLMVWMAGAPMRHDADIPALRQRLQALDARHVVLGRGVQREPVDCDGVAAEWVRVPESLPGRVIFLLHGGSFAFRFPKLHAAFAARLCRQLGASALIPDYRLAPEHPYPAAPDDCLRAWQWLMAQARPPQQVVMVGDSAGGTLALVTLHRLRRHGEPLPACAVLLSPGVDCTLGSPSMVENAHRDPVIRLANLLLMRRHYVPSPVLHTDPDVSPLFGDFSGLPPLLLQTGDTELFRDEALRAAQKAHAAGVDVELEIWRDTLHGFQLTPYLPEATQAITQIVQFVAERTGWLTPQDAVRPGPPLPQFTAVSPPP
jgi:monoterpene epsilon-lactone hydrolase